MKALKYFVLGCLSVGFLISCESFLADDINVDPNKPSNVPVSAMLPNIEIRLIDVYGGDTSRFNSMLSQQVEGVARQWTSFNNYSGLTPNRFDTAWDNYYENILVEVNNMIDASNALGYNHYEGVGKVLKAFALLTMTDLWGKIPYDDAAKLYPNAAEGTTIEYSPTFNDRSYIYTVVFDLLNQARGHLNDAPGDLPLGSDDVIYGGNLDNWDKAIYAIEARAHLHLGDMTSAYNAARQSFEGRGDNMSYTYSASQQAGWWRFNDGRTGDIEFHPTLETMMDYFDDDARLAILNQTFITSHPYHKADYTQALISFREIAFILAEAATDPAEKHFAYLTGIQASFEEVGATTDDYNDYIANSNVDPGVGNLTIEHILTQKYLGLYTQPEVFNDVRRKGYPDWLIPDLDIEPTSGSNFPERWNYPGDELLFNQNAEQFIGTATLFSNLDGGWGSNTKIVD